MPSSSGILFHKEDKSIPVFVKNNKSFIEKWLYSTVKSEKKKIEQINFIFCSDKFLFILNNQFLHHNYYTDIITFDYSDKSVISGDIFISLDRVKDNAKTLNVLYKTEVFRVMAHGVLHLCGYKDKTEKEVEIMRAKEDLYLSKLPCT